MRTVCIKRIDNVLFIRHMRCSSGFIQDLLDHYVYSCRFNDVHVEWTPIHWILDRSI